MIIIDKRPKFMNLIISQEVGRWCTDEGEAAVIYSGSGDRSMYHIGYPDPPSHG